MKSAVIKHSQEHPPLLVLAVAPLMAGVVKLVPTKNFSAADPPQLNIVPSGSLRGETLIARWLVQSAPTCGLYATDALHIGEIEAWLFAAETAAPAALAAALNTALLLRTFLVGHTPTLADYACWTAVRKNHVVQDELVNLCRWVSLLNEEPALAAVIPLLPAPIVPAKLKVKKTAKYVALADAEEGKVVTRFPPEPSGYLHLGHAKAALLNNHYARQYKGKLIMRFDDTNPANEKDEFVKSITADLARLNIHGDEHTHTSDWFPKIQEYADRMLREGKAYIDATPKEKMKEMRGEGIASEYRNQSLEKNLAMWEQMKLGTPEGQAYCMRAKIDMQNPNKCLRDPAIYRVNLTPHHRTGSTYKVYPTYDFACPIVDSLEGVTHALRSAEYHDRNHMYNWMLEAMGLRKVLIEDFARLNFAYTLLSKRKLQWFVDQGYVAGWNDPCFPTVQGLLRRGLSVKTLTEFVLLQGSSKSVTNQSMDKLWAMNRIDLEQSASRYVAIAVEGITKMHVTNGPATPEAHTELRYKKNPALGNKIVMRQKDIYIEGEDAATLAVDEEVTLSSWGNVRITSIGAAGIQAVLTGSTEFKKTKKLTWLPVSEDLLRVDLVELDTLINKPKLEESDTFEMCVNKTLRYITPALADPNLKHSPSGERLQLERRGFWILDEPFLSEDKPLVMFNIPDGKEGAISTLSTKCPKRLLKE